MLAVRPSQQGVFEGGLSEVFEDQNARRLVVPENSWDPDANQLQVAMDVDEGKLRGGLLRRRNLFAVLGFQNGHHHRDVALRISPYPIVGTVAGMTLKFLDDRLGDRSANRFFNLVA